ncbi:something about silencing protein 10 [Diutina catenulata]
MSSDLDETDTFHKQRDQILFDEAGEYAPGSDESEESDQEQEVMGLQDGSSEEDDDDEEEEVPEDDEDDESDEEHEGAGAWGDAYGGDSDDGAEEALKMQKRHLQELAMDDYVDEEVEEGWQKAKEEVAKAETVFSITEAREVDDAERSRLLKQMFPEFVPLVKEMAQLEPQLAELESAPSHELVDLKVAALRGYLGAVSSYFALFVDNLQKGDQFTTMKDSPVMEAILQAREVWRQASELPNDAEEMDVDEESHEVDGHDVDEEIDVEEDMVSDADSEEEVSASEAGSEPEDDDSDAESAASEPEFTIDTTKKRSVAAVPKAGSTTVDEEDKSRRKKSLRFYTAKIDKAQRKKNQLGEFTGDADVPYKEREYERRQRLLEEAGKRGQGGGDLGGDSGDEGADEPRDNGDDYYNEILSAKKGKKAARKQAHVAAKKAAREGKLAEVEDAMGADGKRAINYQILKNKGLTANRKKEFRNARLKKRKQYETAKKKLKSTRAVYDESGHRGAYEGEKTGIKKNLSRSVKLV